MACVKVNRQLLAAAVLSLISIPTLAETETFYLFCYHYGLNQAGDRWVGTTSKLFEYEIEKLNFLDTGSDRARESSKRQWLEFLSARMNLQNPYNGTGGCRVFDSKGEANRELNSWIADTRRDDKTSMVGTSFEAYPE